MKEFEHVIGYASVKKTLSRIADMLKNGENYKKLGAKPPVGVLILGDPGLGKALMRRNMLSSNERQTLKASCEITAVAV